MVFLRLGLVAAVGALMLAASAGAAVPSAEELAAMSNGSLFDAGAKLEALDRRTYDQECELAAYTGEIARRSGDGEDAGYAALFTSYCAMGQGKWDVALAELAKAEALYVDHADPALRIAVEGDLLLSAAKARDSGAFETHLMHVARRGWPDEYRTALPRLWHYGLGLMDVGARGRVGLAFARTAAFTSLPDELQDRLATDAVSPALQAGDKALAVRLVTRRPAPQAILGMLVDRDYEAIWPELEASAGPHMESQLVANLDLAREIARNNPDDEEKQADYILALQWAGHDDEAVKVAALVDHDPGAEEHWEEKDGWIIYYEVRSLDRLGRRTEADSLMDRLGLIPLDDHHHWVVSFAINRADRFLSQGRYTEALPASELAVQAAEKYGNGYAREVALSDLYCAAIRLDPKRPELPGWWSKIEANWHDNVGAALAAALCKGDKKAAIRLVRSGLEDPDTRQRVVKIMQPPEFDPRHDLSDTFVEPRKLLDSDPALRAFFLKYGRDLPPDLMPKAVHPN